MTEEQLKQKFKETYPDFIRGDEPLSPYFDVWEYGIEIATKKLQEELKLEKIENKDLIERVNELEAQIEKMKCGGNCKFEYWKNTGGCYDQKCRFTGLDCTNCEDKWKGKWEND